MTGQNDSAATWLVQRRLPGIQGENGCWYDYEPVEADSAREAMQKVADGELDHMLHAEFRVQPMPEFETFRPEIERTSTRRAVPEPTKDGVAAFGRGWKLIVRLGLALAMTFEYGGRFPRRKVFGFYWQEAGRMVRDA